jgi:uncharacterized membrane protein YbhN (UPF0104 family)
MARTEGALVAGTQHAGGDGAAGLSWWPWLRRALTLLFFGAVAGLLLRFGATVEWASVWRGVRDQAPASLLLAGALAVLSHGLVSSYDLVGRHVTGHGLTVARVWPLAWVSYAFNLNLGALVGGAGLRWRLYARLGLGAAQIAQVYGLSVATNWLAYPMLLGASLLLAPIAVPGDWAVGRQGLQLAGLLAPLVALAYLLACALAPRRRWHWRGHRFDLPSGCVAAVQLLLSTANWLLIAAVIHTLLGRQVDYAQVLGVTLLAAVAGALAHVPAGLGVLEAVFVGLLGTAMPQHEILAALLTYRALYYLGPLVLAVAVYATMELGWRKGAGAAARTTG